MPRYFVLWAPCFFVSLASCSRGLADQREPSAEARHQREPSPEARRELVWELEQASFSRSISPVAPMLSLVHPMLSPGRPTPFCVERVVARQLSLAFGTSRPAQKKSGTTAGDFFSYHEWFRSFFMEDEEIGEAFDVKRKLTRLRCRRSCRFNCDYLERITPEPLDICKKRQHRQTNHHYCH